ncbi:MAG: protein-glutamate O-methyltransferase CheR [Magnetovibrio sp.]|nr:protein-glutamate O-methyltransferase CheR [Magnetovibrio sp.]
MASGYFEYLRDLLIERSGLVLTPDKSYLIETRLMPVALSMGYQNIEEMVQVLKSSRNETLVTAICEAMNTHESLFFRDQVPFDLFKTLILPQLLKRRADKRHFRIWCAACSTGQEPYSLAMVLKAATAKLKGWKTEIIATDISHSVLARARKGLFSQFEIQRGLPVQMLVKHFSHIGEHWQLNQDIRDMVDFRHYNLLTEPKLLGMFDMILCRNVLIYFNVETKTQVLSSIGSVLRDDGVLFLGSAESTMGLTDKLWPVEAGCGVYRHSHITSCIADALETKHFGA